MNNKIVRLNDAKNQTGLSRSSIYAMMASGDFPKSISLGARAVGWLESDIQEWIGFRVNSSRAKASVN